MKTVKDCINEGWPKGKCPAYANNKEELCIIKGLILKGDRIVIPTSLRSEMLDRIHEGHLGVEKQKRLARTSMYWPNMNDIDTKAQECIACQKYRPAQGKETHMESEPMESLDPWEKVGTDLFHWNGQEYVLIVDY